MAVVLITGASSGIGQAMALEYARRGHDVALLARREERLGAVAGDVERAGRRALAIRCDVTDDESVRGAVAQAAAAMGSLDTVIANAGFGVSGRFERLTLEDYRRQFETNVFGIIRTIQAALEPLKQSRGRLAITGSVAGYVAAAGMSPYAMSKFAVRALADSLRTEFRPLGISVTLVSPGFVDSEIRRLDRSGVFREETPDPVPRWLIMPADAAARRIVSAIQRRRAEVVVTAHGKAMVGLQRHVPWTMRWLTRMLAPSVRKV